jgi:uncharacterized phage protein (TIGR02216 family)
MTFAQNARTLCAQCVMLLGWRPSDFWDVTPAELSDVLGAMIPQGADPPDMQMMAQLLRQYPDKGNEHG